MPVSNTVHSSSGYIMTQDPVNDDFRGGEYNIKLEAYMSSKLGQQSNTNYDNYYMDGLCAKNFKFSDMERPFEDIVDTCGIFAAGTGITSDRASKLLMRFLDEKKDWLKASKSVGQMKKRLAETVSYCNSSLIETGELEGETFETSFAVVVYFRESLIYAVCGDVSAVHMKNQQARRLRSQCGNLGIAPYIQPFIGKCEFGTEDRLILLSKGAFADSTPEEICYQIIGKSYPKDIANGIIERVSYINPQDTTCMAVAADPAKGIHTRTLVIAIICLLITLLNILILILNE
ncbi:MAG: hypothetical protein ACI38A_00505 [Candidatus Ornithomonoglobus sp.]